jgi:hypothetical protein
MVNIREIIKQVFTWKFWFAPREPRITRSQQTDGERLTPWEIWHIFTTLKCCDCGTGRIIAGPTGAATEMIMCEHCHSEFSTAGWCRRGRTEWGQSVMNSRNLS